MEQNKSSTMGGNPDIKFPPQTGKAIPYSENGKITGWGALPTSGNYIITVQNGTISFLSAPSGDLKLLNNSLGWTATENCT
jgi:hypothetical protein